MASHNAVKAHRTTVHRSQLIPYSSFLRPLLLCLSLSACATTQEKNEEQQLLTRYQGQLYYTSITLREIPDYKVTIKSELSESTKALQSQRMAQAATTMPFCAAVTGLGSVAPVAYIPGLFCLGSMSVEAAEASKMDSPEKRNLAEKELKANFANLIDNLNSDMFASLLDYGKASGINRIYFRSVPQETDNTVNWSISVGLKSLKFIAIEPKKSGKYSVVFIVHANLHDPSGDQVDSIDYEYTSSPAMLNEWLSDDYQLINKVSKLAYADMAEHIIDEFLLIWHPITPPPVVSKNNADEFVKHIDNTEQNIPLDGVPYYSIKPAYQLRYPGFFSHEPYGLGLQAAHPVKSITPVIEWQQFPQPEQISNPDEIMDVTYDFRIYGKLPVAGYGAAKGLVYFSDKVLYEQKDLSETEFTIPNKLEYCSVYAWTVRARFKHKSYPRVTEWAGAYKAPQPETKPWRSRRNYEVLHGTFGGFYDPRRYYFLIKTPPAPWEKECSTYD